MENTQPSQSYLTDQSIQPEKKKAQIALMLVSAGLVMGVLGGALGFYLGKMSAEKKANPNDLTVQTPVPTTGVVACTDEAKICPDGSAVGRTGPNCEFSACPTDTLPKQQTSGKNFQKRLFDPTKKWFWEEPYPSLVTSISENQLTGLNCSPQYIVHGDGGGVYSSYASDGSASQLSDQTLLSQVNAVIKSTNKRVDAFVSCQTDNNDVIFSFQQEAGGGGMGTVAFVGIVKNNMFTQAAELPNPGIAYFSCSNPLQLAANNTFYLQCGGGDGGGGGSVIYQVDLTNKQSKEVRACNSVWEEVTCK